MKDRAKIHVPAVALAVMFVAAMATARICSTRTAFADQPATNDKEKKLLSPNNAWQRLKEGNNRFVNDRLDRRNVGARRRQELAQGQKPFAVVLTCADSRLTPEFIFDQGL